ncbi:MAG: hypothetical protein HY052_03415 [Proteobacteria bacterium]|nr:hypothetical protein [Pseudomonadota bacterium]
MTPDNLDSNVMPGISNGAAPPPVAADQTEEPSALNRTRTKLHGVINELWGYNWLQDDPYFYLIHYANPDKTKKTKTGFKLKLLDGGEINWNPPSERSPEMISGVSRHFNQASAEAIVALARLRGWKTLDVHGTPAQKEMLWLAAQRQNLQEKEAYERNPCVDDKGNKVPFQPLVVTNFAPLADSRAFVQWKQEEAAYNTQHPPVPAIPPDPPTPAPEEKKAAPVSASQFTNAAPPPPKPVPPLVPWGSDPKKTVIVYHANCIDGSASAFIVAQAKHLTPDDKNVAYIPYEHYMRADAENKIRSALHSESEIYFVDVSPEKPFLDQILAEVQPKEVHVFDHHKSAATALKGYSAPPESTTPVLDIKIAEDSPSNALNLWKQMMPDQAPPAFLQAINYMDGDAKGLTTSDNSGLTSHEKQAAAAYLDSQDTRTPLKASQFFKGMLSQTFNEVSARGAPILADQDIKLTKLMDQTIHIDLQILPDAPPVRVPVTNGNVQNFGRDISERMIDLAQKDGGGVSLAWFVTKQGGVEVSMRSNGSPDLTRVIDHLKKTTGCGGGGHATAAVMRFSSLEEFAKHIPLNSLQPTGNAAPQNATKPAAKGNPKPS